VSFYNGTTSSFVGTGDAVSDATWRQVTVMLDFTSKQYDGYVDAVLKQSGLGFSDAAVSKLNGFTNFSSTESFLDSFRALPMLKGDANLDGKVDVGDTIVLANYLNGTAVTDMIVLNHLDVNGSGGNPDNADLTALVNLILGK
jgi:hypothetical protein